MSTFQGPRGGKRRPQPEWMAKVKVGSVLRNRRGTDFRAVRKVSRYSNGDLHCVTLAIRKCSWTKRPYTVVNYNDLQYMGYDLVEGVRIKLDRALDFLLEQNIIDSDRKDMDCSLARGIP